MKEYTRELHSKITGIEKKEKIFGNCFLAFSTFFLVSPILSILLDTFFNRYKIIILFAGIAVIGLFISILGINFYSKIVFKAIFGEEVKWLFNKPYEELSILLKKFEREIREEGILEKDFDEALYLRMKYFFENEIAEIIQKRKIETAIKEELQRRKMEEQAEEGRKKMQKFSDKYSGNLELEKKR